MSKIVVVGDSHASLFDNNPERKRGLWSNDSYSNLFDAKHIGPTTLYKVGRDDLYNLCRINELSTGQKCMLSFGEIDIRCHIIKQSQTQLTSVRAIVDDLISSLKKRLLEFNYKLYDLHILSVLPPIKKDLCTGPNPQFPFIGTDEERKDATIYLNNGLKKICSELNIGYFNQYDLYVDKDGYLDLEKSDKIVHAWKTLELEVYITKYFNL